MSLRAFLIAALFLLIFIAAGDTLVPEYSIYIVYVDSHLQPSQYETAEQWYVALLDDVTGNSRPLVEGIIFKSDRLIYIYHNFGFAAKLTSHEADILSSFNGVLSVQKDQKVSIDAPPTT